MFGKNGCRGRTLYRDWVTAIWWKAGVLITSSGMVLVAVGYPAWLPGTLAFAFLAWQSAHAGVWVGKTDILVVHPVKGKKRVPWADIERLEAKPFNQWMIAWVITRSGKNVPCQGISSGRKRTQRVDTVVACLNLQLQAPTPDPMTP